MKNFPIIDKATGREYWISRSVAVVVLVLAEYNNDTAVLACKRGNGTPDPEYIGFWCLPCGYVDFDETIVQAAKRELFEETGLNISEDKFKLNGVMDNPSKDKRQNISFRYVVDLTDESLEEICNSISNENSEPDEVDDIRFISLSQINSYNWAFNHSTLIKEILS